MHTLGNPSNFSQQVWLIALVGRIEVFFVFANDRLVHICQWNRVGQDDARGTHVNISGMAMAKYAPNAQAALAFMDFLSSDTAQAIYASENYEYPVNPNVEPSDLLKSWGDFKADNLGLADIAAQREMASRLVEKIRFNN